MQVEGQDESSTEKEDFESSNTNNNVRTRSRNSNNSHSRSLNVTTSNSTQNSVSSSVLPSPVTPHPPQPPTTKPRNKTGPKRGSHHKNSLGRRSSITNNINNSNHHHSKKDQPHHNKKKFESHSPQPVIQEVGANDDETNVTRCVCGEDNEEANDVIMFQCDRCSVWQHGPCVGLYIEFPGDYFCEKCRPDLHTTGQYQKSSPAHRSKRSPSFTSISSRRDRVATDAASLAAFLTDAGVKPEDQISLGGFALPIFAQTRRQSNMLVDGSLPGLKKQNNNNSSNSNSNINSNGNGGNDASNNGGGTGVSESSETPGNLSEGTKSKRKRSSEELSEVTPIAEVEAAVEERTKRPRVSPVSDSPLRTAGPSGVNGKQAKEVSNTTGITNTTKQKRVRKADDGDDGGTSLTLKQKASGVFGGRNANQSSNSTTTTNRRGSPTKRGREDGRRTKSTIERESSPQDGWGLPDHLSYLEYLLPSPTPQPLVLDDGKTEAPTKIKFPSKRTTIADLKKRSKHLVDYLQKVQIESSDREKRNELIVKSMGGKVSIESAISPETLKIIDDLSRELYHWQERYKA